MKNIFTLILCSALTFQPAALCGLGPDGQPIDDLGKGKGFPDQPASLPHSQSPSPSPAMSPPQQPMPPSSRTPPSLRSAQAAQPPSPAQARKPMPSTPVPPRKRPPLNLDGSIRQPSSAAGKASKPAAAQAGSAVHRTHSENVLPSSSLGAHGSPSPVSLPIPPFSTGSLASHLAMGVSAVGSLSSPFAPLPLNPPPTVVTAHQEDDAEQASSPNPIPINAVQLASALSSLALALQGASENQSDLLTVLTRRRPASGRETPTQSLPHNGSRRGSATASPAPISAQADISEEKAQRTQNRPRSNSAGPLLTPASRNSNSPHPLKVSASAIQLESPSAAPTIKPQRNVGFSPDSIQPQQAAAFEDDDEVPEETPAATPMRERKDTQAVVDDTYQAAEDLAGAFAPRLKKVLENPKVKDAVKHAAAHGRVRGIVRAFAEAQYVYQIIVGVLTAIYAVWSFFYQAQSQLAPGQPPSGGAAPPQ